MYAADSPTPARRQLGAAMVTTSQTVIDGSVLLMGGVDPNTHLADWAQVWKSSVLPDGMRQWNVTGSTINSAGPHGVPFVSAIAAVLLARQQLDGRDIAYIIGGFTTCRMMVTARTCGRPATRAQLGLS